MQFRGVAALLLLPAVAAILDAPTKTTAAAPAATPSGSDAVTKVVNLLTELKARIESDNTQEQEVFDKYACWCESITAKKAAAIEEAKSSLTAAGNTILELKGTVAVTISEINQLMSDIKENEKNQQQLTAVRQKENAAYEAERQELTEATTALESAVKVLVDATSLLGNKGKVHQGQEAAASAVSAAAAAALDRAQEAAVHLPTAAAREGAQKNLATLAEATKQSRYAPQSATIQGILKDMYGSFTTTLETITKEENTASRNYEDLMATYHASLVTMQETLTKKEKVKAEAEVQLADATQQYDDLEAQIKVDVEFFDAAKAGCVSKASDWSERKALRTEEAAGIQQALDILTSDDAKALFGTAITPGVGFLQLAAYSDPVARAIGAADKELTKAAQKTKSIRLAAVVASLRDQAAVKAKGVGHFDSVIQAIDTMVATLADEEATDIQRADSCKESLHNTAKAQAQLEWEIEKNTAKIDKLEKDIEALNTEVTETITELESVQAEMTEMTSTRTAENQAFLQGKKDDENAIELLIQAKTAISSYYEKNSIDISLAQHAKDLPSGAAPVSDYAPEAKFSGKGDRKLESKGVVQLLDMIVEDLQTEIAGAEKSEAASQLQYEKTFAAAEATVEQLTEKKANLDETIALQEQSKVDENALKGENEGELATEHETESDLTPSCTWMAANLEPRRQKRALESEALKNAKNYLADAMPSLVQAKIARHSLRGA